MAHTAPIANTSPHEVFFSPPGTRRSTWPGRMTCRRMNHFALVANQ